jgi:hypothetical protein
MSKQTKWDRVAAAKAAVDAIIREQETAKYATASPEFEALTERYIAAREELLFAYGVRFYA